MIDKYSPETIEFLSVAGFVACALFAVFILALVVFWIAGRMEAKSDKEAIERRFREDTRHSLRDLEYKMDAICKVALKPTKPTRRTTKKGK